MPMDELKYKSKGFAFVEFVDKKVFCNTLQHYTTYCIGRCVHVAGIVITCVLHCVANHLSCLQT